MNNWQKDENYRLQPIGNGVWEAIMPEEAIKHEQLYKLLVEWQGGYGERIPSYVRRVVQDEQTKIFSAQVWDEEPYVWKHKADRCAERPLRCKTAKAVRPQTVSAEGQEALYIYECHIGMSSEQEKVNSYEEFRRDVLPRIAALGYYRISSQLPAVSVRLTNSKRSLTMHTEEASRSSWTSFTRTL